MIEAISTQTVATETYGNAEKWYRMPKRRQKAPKKKKPHAVSNSIDLYLSGSLARMTKNTPIMPNVPRSRRNR